MQREGSFRKMKDIRYYVKPSKKAVLKREEARRRRRKIDRKKVG